MKQKILILDVTESTTTNRGAMATILGAIECLKGMPVELDLYAFSARLETDKRLERYGLKVLPHPWYTGYDSKFKVLLSCMVKIPWDIISTATRRLLRNIGIRVSLNYENYQAVLVLDADSYNEKYYGSLLTIFRLVNLYLAKILIRKPMLVGPATIGHFTSPLTRSLAKWILKMPDYIAAREETTGEYLASLGVASSKRPLIPELGYFMTPSSQTDVIITSEGIKGVKRPLVGIAPSQQLPTLGLFREYPGEERAELNLKLMLEIINHIKNQFQANIVLIPHSPNYQYSKDDRILVDRIYERSQHNNNPVYKINGDYTADELKGIIGHFDMLVACRMHAAIAAVSQGIPTISLAYGQKYNGVIGKMLKQEDYIVNIEHKTYNELLKNVISKIDELFYQRESVHESLLQHMSLLKQNVREYSRLTASMLN